MRSVQQGDRVRIRYIGTLDNGRIFDSTDDHGPLSLVVGAGTVFPALESALLGMRVGEAKNLLIPAAEAYGPRLAENQLTLRRDQLPCGREPRLGERLQLSLANGESLEMRVLRVSAEGVLLDGNHPLAGLDLTFALTVDAID
jgi:FKBP-type peptidyl-prolyl cis-trans isomerase 2